MMTEMAVLPQLLLRDLSSSIQDTLCGLIYIAPIFELAFPKLLRCRLLVLLSNVPLRCQTANYTYRLLRLRAMD
jgi:hypothetical protein